MDKTLTPDIDVIQIGKFGGRKMNEMTKVILYGAGSNSAGVYSKLADKYNLVCFADKDESKQGTSITMPGGKEMRILSPKQALAKYDDAKIYVTLPFSRGKGIATELVDSLGIDRKRFMSYHRLDTVCPYFRGELTFHAFHREKPLSLCCDPRSPGIQFSPSPKETYDNFSGMMENLRNEVKACLPFEDRIYTQNCADCSQRILELDSAKSNTEDNLIRKITIASYPALCQCRCCYCHGFNAHNNVMDDDNVKLLYEKMFETLSYFKENGYIAPNAKWDIASGEITIHPYRNKIFDVVGDMQAIFFTNGFLFSERIAENLSKNPDSQVFLSIDCGTAETWKQIKGVDNFHTVLKNLGKYYATLKYKEQISLKYIILAGINDNDEDFQGVIEIMKSLDVSYLTISRDFIANRDEVADIRAAKRLICLLESSGLGHGMINFS